MWCIVGKENFTCWLHSKSYINLRLQRQMPIAAEQLMFLLLIAIKKVSWKSTPTLNRSDRRACSKLTVEMYCLPIACCKNKWLAGENRLWQTNWQQAMLVGKAHDLIWKGTLSINRDKVYLKHAWKAGLRAMVWTSSVFWRRTAWNISAILRPLIYCHYKKIPATSERFLNNKTFFSPSLVYQFISDQEEHKFQQRKRNPFISVVINL